MIKTKLVDKLSILFPQGMHYQEAVEISKTLFCSTSWLPDVLEEELCLDNICEVFAFLSSQGFIIFEKDQNNFEFSTKKYWINIIREILDFPFNISTLTCVVSVIGVLLNEQRNNERFDYANCC